jgi:Leucine Rich repeat
MSTIAKKKSIDKALKKNGSATLYWCGLNAVDAKYLATQLKDNKTVTELWLNTNSIGDVGAHHIAEALCVNDTLTCIDLSNNGICDVGAQHIAAALRVNDTLRVIYLSSNSIDAAGVQCIAQTLRVNDTLTYIDLGWNYMGDAAGQHIVASLRMNGTLTQIYLVGNNIEDETLDSINSLLSTDAMPERVRRHAAHMESLASQDASSQSSRRKSDSRALVLPVVDGIEKCSVCESSFFFGYNEEKLAQRERIYRELDEAVHNVITHHRNRHSQQLHTGIANAVPSATSSDSKLPAISTAVSPDLVAGDMVVVPILLSLCLMFVSVQCNQLWTSTRYWKTWRGIS